MGVSGFAGFMWVYRVCEGFQSSDCCRGLWEFKGFKGKGFKGSKNLKGLVLIALRVLRG